MTKTATCIGSVSVNLKIDMQLNKARMLKYKTLAAAFSYPDDNFFKFFPQTLAKRQELAAEYDRLFRLSEIWLYTTEYVSKNEFQRAEYLSDIVGFYRAFALERDKDRPDSLVTELEFMYYLIFKSLYAIQGNGADKDEKVFVCIDAQKKFFTEHLSFAAEEIARRIISQTKNNFYREIAQDILEFMKAEERYLQ